MSQISCLWLLIKSKIAKSKDEKKRYKVKSKNFLKIKKVKSKKGKKWKKKKKVDKIIVVIEIAESILGWISFISSGSILCVLVFVL